MENKIVYLIRHGEIELKDGQRRYIGQLDVPLNKAGIRQARLLKRRLDRAEIETVYCSDLFRSRQTAEIIVGDKGVIITPHSDLREISLGEWEGCSFTEIARRFPDEFKARGADIGYYRPPGGESFANCSRRVVAAFHEIVGTATGDIVIVGHAGVNRLLLCHMLGMPFSNLFRIGQDYGCINIIQSSNSGYRLKLMNFR